MHEYDETTLVSESFINILQTICSKLSFKILFQDAVVPQVVVVVVAVAVGSELLCLLHRWSCKHHKSHHCWSKWARKFHYSSICYWLTPWWQLTVDTDLYQTRNLQVCPSYSSFWSAFISEFLDDFECKLWLSCCISE